MIAFNFLTVIFDTVFALVFGFTCLMLFGMFLWSGFCGLRGLVLNGENIDRVFCLVGGDAFKEFMLLVYLYGVQGFGESEVYRAHSS